MKTEPIGNCSQCGQTAAWNSPALDEAGNLWCDTCKKNDRTGKVFREVNQFTEDGNYTFDGGVALNGVIVTVDKSAWIEGGSRAVRLTETEKKLDVLEIARLVDQEHNVDGLTRCTGCGVAMTKDQIAGYPLFAGVTCAPCWKKHQEDLETERKNGHVCRMCGKPYSACYC